MAPRCLSRFLLLLLCAETLNGHPVIVCNCNTNITISTSSNGSTARVSAISTPNAQAQPQHKDDFNLSSIDGNIQLSKDRQVVQRDNVDICVDPDCVIAAARMLDSMESKVDPCEDFFEYACGAWNKRHVIPDDADSYTTFTQLREELAVIIRGLLEEELSQNDIAAVKKTKNFYKSCMGDEAIKNVGPAPLYDLLDELGGWPVLNGSAWNDTNFDIITLLSKLSQYNNYFLFNMWVNADDKNSDRNIIQFDQTELGMPTRDHYMGDCLSCEEYYKYAVKVAISLGADPDIADKDMREMLDFEIAIANISIPQEKRRDSQEHYKKMTVGDMMRNISEFDWLRYMKTIFRSVDIDITEDEEVVVFALEYLVDLVKFLEITDNRVIANYLMWRFVMKRVNNLGKLYRDLKNEYTKEVYGTEMEPARWRDCVAFVNENMGKVIGRLFVEKHFDMDAKKQALRMVSYLRESFYNILNQTHWMDDETKIAARQKIETMEAKIGFPDDTFNDTALDEDFQEIDFDPDRYFNNILSNIQNRARDNFRKLRKPVDKREWTTTPAVVNAFYSTAKNQILFPAGIMQRPFYSKSHPRSLNFGGIGMVIGHEITHGFDDRGRLYDRHGNMKQWWNDDVIERFKVQARCIVEQYGNFTLTKLNMKLSGILTQGENIADNGGLKEAYWAYRMWIDQENGGKEEPRLPGLEHLDNNQLFFLNFAQVWCGTLRPERALTAARMANHSPGKFRVWGTLQNSKEFAMAYKCPENSPMNPDEKCSVW